jgi:transcriptional regulator with XRE-family HTH domain
MSKTIDEKTNDLLVGTRIKKIREEKDLDINDLAAKCGFSRALVSQIENNLISPPISTLLRIANALGMNISYLFHIEDEDEKTTVVRSNERLLSLRRQVSSNLRLGYTYETLAHKKLSKHMEPFLVTFEVKNKDKIVRFSHNGEEFAYVIEGSLEFSTDNETIVLETGDSIYFESDQLHGFRALGERPAKAVVVVYQK